MGHLTVNLAPPNLIEDKYKQWEQDDLVVFSWFIQSIVPHLANNLNVFPTTEELRDALVVM